MKKQSRILRGMAFLTLCMALFAACPSVTKPDTQKFTAAPVLQATAGNKRLDLQWTPSVPAADSYDVYYREGNYDNAAAIKGGEKIQNTASPDIITGLDNDVLYSILVTANKSGYESIDSIMVQETPGLTFTAPPSLTLENITGGLIVNWTAATPPATSYDIYYREGSYNLANQVKEGIKITGATSGHEIEGLTEGTTYSVVVTAKHSGYRDLTSEVRIITVQMTGLSGLSAPVWHIQYRKRTHTTFTGDKEHTSPPKRLNKEQESPMLSTDS